MKPKPPECPFCECKMELITPCPYCNGTLKSLAGNGRGEEELVECLYCEDGKYWKCPQCCNPKWDM